MKNRCEKVCKELDQFRFTNANLVLERERARREVSDLRVCVTELVAKVRALRIFAAVKAEPLRSRNKNLILLQLAATRVQSMEAGYKDFVSDAESTYFFLQYRPQHFLRNLKPCFDS